MNHESDITISIKGKYGFRGEPDALRARVAETLAVRGVEFIPALDDLVDLVRASSGRARRASIDTVTKTVLSLSSTFQNTLRSWRRDEWNYNPSRRVQYPALKVLDLFEGEIA